MQRFKFKINKLILFSACNKVDLTVFTAVLPMVQC